MKFIQKIGLFALSFCLIQASRHSPDPTVFWGSTPCDALPRKLLSIPATTDCELIKWNLALRNHPRTQAPTLFTLSYTYGMSKPSTQDLMYGGTSAVKEGTWARSEVGSGRMVYKLTPAADTGQPIAFLKLQDNLLHLLDQEGKLMIGHAGWSYTMNRK